MIGKLYSVLMPYYDIVNGTNSYKKRPALIIANADKEDYVILPVSTITKKWNIDPVYDIEIDPGKYPELHLNKLSYVRTHKQTIIHRSMLGSIIGDLKGCYNELYLLILEKRDDFSKNITAQALQ